MERCSSVYHADNSEDSDRIIGESFGGVGRIGTKSGIFHGNDTGPISVEAGSQTLYQLS